jgi:hypothetical protein
VGSASKLNNNTVVFIATRPESKRRAKRKWLNRQLQSVTRGGPKAPALVHFGQASVLSRTGAQPP